MAEKHAPIFRNLETPPLQRLKQFFEATRLACDQEAGRSGCPIGNLTQEMGGLSEAFQARLRRVLNGMKHVMRECLEDARSRDEIDPTLDSSETADFILNSWQGALLRMKAEGNTQPLLLFEQMVFGHLLLKR
jgi:TetR/AcrR family transcriptional repressor of nem operon